MVPQEPFSSSPAAPDNWLKVEDCGYAGSLPGVNVSTCVNVRKGEKNNKLCLWGNSGAEVGWVLELHCCSLTIIQRNTQI